MPGPIPKRSDQRRRRNASNQVDTVAMSETVAVPELALTDVHPIAADMYRALTESGQAQYFEPSDWQRARLMCEMVSRLLDAGKLSSMLYAAIQADMNALLFTEGERRKVRMEIERGVADTSAQDARVSQMAAYRRVAGA
jgi:hypothetical protein